MGQTGLISMSEIAELANVHRPVVTVWRRRHHDSFPHPAGGDAARPLFDSTEIVQWLVATGRAQREGGQDIHADLHKHTLSHLAATIGPTDLIRYGTALICLRLLDDDEPLIGPEPLVARAARVDPDDSMLLTEMRDLPTGADGLPEAMDNLIEATWSCDAAFDRLLDDRHRLGATGLCRDAVAPGLSRLVAKLGGARLVAGWGGAVRIVDPWAGVGDLLAAVVREIGEEGAALVSASTTDEYLARLLRRRLTVHGVARDDQEIVAQGATRLRSGEWDVLVTRTPYRSAERRLPGPDLDVLRDLATRLQGGQCAVVLAPAGLVADRLGPTAEAMRAHLLRTGVVEAVVTLPAGLMPFRPGYRMALWVLRHDESGHARGRVMLADVSDRALTDEVAGHLVEDITTWRREGYRPAAQRRSVAHPVTVDELLSGTASLSEPRRPEPTEAVRLGPARIAALLEVEARLARTAQAPPQPLLRSGALARGLVGRRTVTVGSLLADGRLIRVSGTRLRQADIVRSAHHRVMGVPELVESPPGPLPDRAVDDLRPAPRSIDRATLASQYRRAPLTEPGDVVVTLVPRPAAIVDEQGFSVLEFPATALRLGSHPWPMTPRVLAALVQAAPLANRAPGAARGARLDHLHLPILEDSEVAALDELLRQVDERERRAREELDTLDALRRITLAGLVDGTLTVAATS
jgi:hypothetical protein